MINKSRSRRRKKNQTRRLTALRFCLTFTAVTIVAAGTAALGLKARGQSGVGGQDPRNNLDTAAWVEKAVVGESEEQTKAQKESQAPGDKVFSDFQAGVVNLNGLTGIQAEKKFSDAYQWELQITYGDELVPVKNLTKDWVEQTAKQIKSGSLPEKGSAQPDYDQIEKEAQKIVRELADRWDRSPESSQVEAYNRDTGVYSYSQEKSGRRLEQEALVNTLMEAVRSGNLKASIQPEFAETPPARTRSQAKEQYRVIGTFTTKTTDNKNRNQNIHLAAEAIDGLVLRPGQEFSFNSATGNRTSEKGYQPAGAYKNGVLIEEPGGGVCQVSTTLYHAIIGAGYKTTERNAHSFAPSYVEQGQDAMVSFDGYAGPDLKFVNTGSAAVVLRASFDGRNLKMSIVGIPILDEGVKISIRSEKVRDVEAPEPVYEENASLPFGTEKTIESGKSGSVWKSYRIISKNGEILKEEPLHNSGYKAKTAVIQRNTLTPPPEGAAADSAALEGITQDKNMGEGPLPEVSGQGGIGQEGSGQEGTGQEGTAQGGEGTENQPIPQNVPESGPGSEIAAAAGIPVQSKI